MDMPDGTVDVGGMIIQVELPPDGVTTSPNVHTTGIGQLGSVLQNMMQEQLAAARMSQGRSSPAAPRQGAPDAHPEVPPGAATGAASAPADAGVPLENTALPTGPAQPPPAASLPQRVLQLTQQLVADISQQQSLPEAERSAAGARMTASYLRQVPELLRQALPGVAAGVDSFMSEIRGGGGPADSVAPTGGTAAPAQALEPAAAGSSAPRCSTAGPAAHALDLGSEDHSPAVPDEPAAPLLSAASGTSASGTAATAGVPGVGPSSGTAPESTKPDRPEPKGLARGLKPRKPKGLGLGTGTRAAPSDMLGSRTRSASGAGGATGTNATDSGVDALPTMVPGGPMGAGGAGGAGASPGLEALLGSLGGGGAGGAAGGGGGLMDLVANMAQNPNVQNMMASPQMQDIGNQMESGNADFGSLIQQMMPMVGSMLGGGAGGPGGLPGMPPMPPASGAGAPAAATGAGAGARSTAAGAGMSSGAGSAPDVGAFRGMLGELMGEGEADRWMRQIIQDRGVLRQQGAASGDQEHSDVYSAGAIPEEAGKGLFGM